MHGSLAQIAKGDQLPRLQALGEASLTRLPGVSAACVVAPR
jgi:hypothetical protein